MAKKKMSRKACIRSGKVWRKGGKGRSGSCARKPRKRRKR